MKKRVIKFFTIVLALLSFVCTFSACGTEKKESVEPGNYIFDKASHDFFVDVNIYGEGKQKFSSPTTELEIEIATAPKRYVYYERRYGCGPSYEDILSYYFDDCSIDVEIIINEEVKPFTLRLSTEGKTNFTYIATVAPTYEAKVDVKIVDASGIVACEIYEGATFESGDFEYEYVYNEEAQEYTCQLKGKYLFTYSKKVETLYFSDYVVNEDGNKIKFQPNYYWLAKHRGNIISFFTGNREMSKTKTIIFDGDFLLEDIDFSVGVMSANGYYVETAIKDVFPNLERIAIRSLNYNGGKIDELPIGLPETGVDFYVNDYSGIFIEKLSNTYFVNGVYSFDDFDMNRYVK